MADDFIDFLAAALQVFGEGPFEAAELLLVAAPLLPAARHRLHLHAVRVPEHVRPLLISKVR